MKKYYDFLLGADPELAFYKDGNKIRADLILHNQELFGLDHCNRIAEIRPVPSTNPLDLTKNIRYCLQWGLDNHENTKKYDWIAGSRAADDVLGGHLHIGLNHIPKFQYPNQYCKAYQQLITALDNYVAVPCALMEDEEDAAFRKEGEYGQLGAVRNDQKWGPEYRTLASWLTHPDLTRGVLCLAYITIWESINGTKAVGDYIEEDDFNGHNVESIKMAFQKVRPELTTFELYKEYADHIEAIYELIDNGYSWKHKDNLKKTWGLTTKPSPQKIRTIKELYPNRQFSPFTTQERNPINV